MKTTAIVKAGDHHAITSPAMLDRFTQYIDASPRTVESYSKAVRLFIEWTRQNGITQPRREDLIRYRDELAATHKATTVQTYLIAVRQFFKWTEAENLYTNVADRVKGVRVQAQHKKDALTPTQAKDVINTLREKGTPEAARDLAVVALAVTGGLRTIEIKRAKVEDLRTLGSYTVLYVQGKGRTEKAEYIKITTEVEKLIRAYLSTRTDATPGSPLFTSNSNRNTGEELTTRSISRLIKAAIVEAGYNSDRLTAHSLRHTAVTIALTGGMTLQEAQQFARHSNIATTTIYAHNLERMNNRCEETISAALF